MHRQLHGPAEAPTGGSAERQGWIEAAKGISILIVVWYHVVGSYRLDGAPAALLDVNANWDVRLRNSMSVFFFISGLFAIRTIRRSGRGFWQYLVERLLYPYVLWSVITVLLSVYVAGGDANRTFQPQDLLLIAWRPIMQYWYLLALMVYLILCRVVSRFDPTLRWMLALVPVAWLGLVVGVGTDGYFSRMLELHLGFFVVGLLFGTPIVAALRRRTDLSLLAIVAAGIFLIVMVIRPSASWPSWHVLPAISGVIPLATVLALALVIGRRRPGSWLEYVGTRSLEIYVVHVIVVAAVRTALFRLGVTSIPLHLALTMLAGTTVPLVLEAVVTRYQLPSPFRLPTKWSIGPRRSRAASEA